MRGVNLQHFRYFAIRKSAVPQRQNLRRALADAQQCSPNHRRFRAAFGDAFRIGGGIQGTPERELARLAQRAPAAAANRVERRMRCGAIQPCRLHARSPAARHSQKHLLRDVFRLGAVARDTEGDGGNAGVFVSEEALESRIGGVEERRSCHHVTYSTAARRFVTFARYLCREPVDIKSGGLMEGFAGKAFVVRVDEETAFATHTTFFDDLTFLARQSVHAIVVAPTPRASRALVRAINRSGNSAVGLSGSDAAMLPGTPGGIGNVQTGILETLTGAGYIPVIEPTAFSVFASRDTVVQADDVARAIAAATDAVRAVFFHVLGGVTDPETAALITELTPAEALTISDDGRVPADLRAAIRAAALGVRAGVEQANIVDGRIAHATVVELLTAHHLGTRVTGSVFTGAA